MDDLTDLFYQQVVMPAHVNKTCHAAVASGWRERDVALRSQLHAAPFGLAGTMEQMRGLEHESQLNCISALTWFRVNAEWCNVVLKERSGTSVSSFRNINTPYIEVARCGRSAA